MKEKVSLSEDIERILKPFKILFWDPVKEILIGFKEKNIPLAECLIFGSIMSLASDRGLFGLGIRHFGFHFKMNNFMSGLFGFLLVFSGLYFWGLRQYGLRAKLQRKLSDVFLQAGLKTKLNEFPQFIFDQPLGSASRKLRLRARGLSETAFRQARESLEAGLNIFLSKVENPKGNKEFVDLIYTTEQMPESWLLDDLLKYKDYSFPVGRSFEGEIITSLKKVPHFLVAGETGSGKSTFINSMLMVLAMNNQDLKVLYIDLKAGMENQLFYGMEQFELISDISNAESNLLSINSLLDSRMQEAARAGAKNIEIFNSRQQNHRDRWGRVLVVVDEAAEIIPTVNNPDKARLARIQSIINRLTRLGRAVGLHVVIGVQKPDHKNLDATIKANLPGVVCFSVSHFTQSTIVLGNSHAADLNKELPGRGIWKHGSFEVEIQAPFLSPENVEQAIIRKAKYFKQSESIVKEVVHGEQEASKNENAYYPRS